MARWKMRWALWVPASVMGASPFAVRITGQGLVIGVGVRLSTIRADIWRAGRSSTDAQILPPSFSFLPGQGWRVCWVEQTITPGPLLVPTIKWVRKRENN